MLTRKDALLSVSKALPNGAATISSDPIDLGKGPKLADGELLLEIPALATGLLPDTQTVTYTIESCADAAFGSGVVSHAQGTVQTGAGGAGAVATKVRHKPASTSHRYWRAKAVKTGAANASAASLTLSYVT